MSVPAAVMGVDRSGPQPAGVSENSYPKTHTTLLDGHR